MDAVKQELNAIKNELHEMRGDIVTHVMVNSKRLEVLELIVEKLVFSIDNIVDEIAGKKKVIKNYS